MPKRGENSPSSILQLVICYYLLCFLISFVVLLVAVILSRPLCPLRMWVVRNSAMPLVIHRTRHKIIVPFIVPGITGRATRSHVFVVVDPIFVSSKYNSCSIIYDQMVFVACRCGPRSPGGQRSACGFAVFPPHTNDISRMSECANR